MSWTRVRTSTNSYVETDLDEFDTAQLLQGLIDDKAITELEAELILNRKNKGGGRILADDTEYLLEATIEMRRGRKREALIALEEYLGREWRGVLT